MAKTPVVMYARFEWRIRNNLRDSALQVLENYSTSATIYLNHQNGLSEEKR